MLLRYWIGRSVGLLKSWLHTLSYRSDLPNVAVVATVLDFLSVVVKLSP